MKRWWSAVAVCGFFSLLLDAPTVAVASPQSSPPVEQQLVVVQSPTWYAKTGTLTKYTRAVGGTWAKVGTEVPVNLGRNGMAWGIGLREAPEDGPKKVEGDGKSPAGVFDLGEAFGAATALPTDAHDYPYRQATPHSYCVEDVRSSNYNRLVDLTDEELVPWRRRSPLLRPDGLFEWGVFVRHNSSPAAEGRGSCVFLHVWRGEKQSTAGCTSLDKPVLESLVAWLDPKKSPRLVQLPEGAYRELQEAWDLP